MRKFYLVLIIFISLTATSDLEAKSINGWPKTILRLFSNKKSTEEKPVTKPEPEKTIKIYPNPARHLINISGLDQYEGSQTVKIFDITGTLRSEFTTDRYNSRNLPVNLVPGLYIVQIKSGAEILSVQKIMIIE